MTKSKAIQSFVSFVFIVSFGLIPLGLAGMGTYPHRGYFELSLATETHIANPYKDVEFKVAFERPDGSKVTVDGFYDGDWIVLLQSENALTAKGPLRIHPKNPPLFASLAD